MKNDLVKKILDSADKINKHSRKGNGNWLIVSSETKGLIDSLDIMKQRKNKIDKILNKIKNDN